MKSFTFTLTEFEPKYFLAWTISSQCYNTGTVTIKSGGKTLCQARKDRKEWNFTVLSQGTADLAAKGVEVEVVINEATADLKNSKTGGAIMDNAGGRVGYVYSLCIEDSTDADYNDIYINIVGWAKKG
jgi:hypothetical protein